MLLKLGESYNVSLLITDINGNRVSNDTPSVIIKDLETGNYWNGIAWSTSQSSIIMSYVANGVYSYSFIPNKIGLFQVSCSSATYSISKTESLEVYDGNIASYDWMTGNEFIAKYTDLDGAGSAEIMIFRGLDSMYFNGTDWQTDQISIPMALLQDNVYTFSFIPPVADTYTITIVSGSNQQIYNLNVQDTGDNVQPIAVNSSTIMSTDGTDCTLVDGSGTPLLGVQVSIYSSGTQQLVSRTMTNSQGQWSLLLKPDLYVFMFEKEGYATISFQRSVM